MGTPLAYDNCPPLEEWLGSLGEPVGLTASVSIPRPMRGLVEPWDAVGPETLGLGLHVVFGALDDPATARAVEAVRPGGYVVELMPQPWSLAHAVLAMRRSPARVAARGYASLERWVRHGLFEPSQYRCLAPAELLVTCGRVRAG